MFPLGEIPKTKVREIAEQIGLPNAKKKDSTGICFIGERPFRDFLNRYLPTKPGPMKTPDGKVVGEHIGLAFYTFGQRKGIGLGGSKDGSGEPWFVAGKDIASNTLYVVQGHDHPWLLSRELVAGNVSWVAGEPPADGFACGAKTRYRQADAPCSFARAKAGEAGEARFSLGFDDAAMGRHARPVGGALRRRDLPGRRHHRIGRDRPAGLGRGGRRGAHARIGERPGELSAAPADPGNRGRQRLHGKRQAFNRLQRGHASRRADTFSV